MSENVLIITGMHRSGTSLVARFIHHSGIDLGETLMGPHESNKYGHFEDMEFYQFHRNILIRKCNHDWMASAPPGLGREEEQRARELISAREHKAYWGWKDPRTCLFLDFWDNLLPRARYLFLVRHPLSVLESICQRDTRSPYAYFANNKYLKVWFAYNRECLNFLEKNRSRCVMAVLERLIEIPETFVSLLSERFYYNFDLEKFRESYDGSVLRNREELIHRWFSRSLQRKCEDFYNQLKETADV